MRNCCGNLLALTALGAACPSWWSDADPDTLASASSTQSCVTDCNPTSLASPTDTADPPATDATTTAANSSGTSTTDALPPGSSSSTTDASVVSSSSAETGLPVPPTIDDGWCDSFDANAIYLAGTYEQGAAYRKALARLDLPRVGCVGFELEARDFIVRPTDNSLVWVEEAGDVGIHVFVRDPQIWGDDQWVYPDDSHANDTVLPTVACIQQEPWDDYYGPRDLLVHPGDGSMVYSCNSDLPLQPYYDMDGVVVLESSQQTPLSLGFDGSFLTIGPNNDAASLQLISPGDDPIDVTGPAATAKVLGVKARPQGFWIAAQTDSWSVERWSVDDTGAGTLDGAYGASEYGYPKNYVDFKLDGDGDAVFLQYVTDGDTIGVHARLVPGQSDIIYSTKGVPDSSWPTDPAPFVYPLLKLFTGP